MVEHVLKSWPEFFQALESGEKTFELRRNDRDFKVGDELVLQEWDPKVSGPTGRVLRRRVVYLMHGVGVGAIEPLKGLAIGYAILGLGPDAGADR